MKKRSKIREAGEACHLCLSSAPLTGVSGNADCGFGLIFDADGGFGVFISCGLRIL